ncbi:MAG TPA: rhomboid family intramembrane serine protease [Acidimicrobiales bacterium]|nr:rhomboid family intramembrane serine protease [Acidimicrobiales bacterium]
MLPLKDENPTRRLAILTVALIAACVIVYFFVQPTAQTALVASEDKAIANLEFNFTNAAIPCELVQRRPLTTEEVHDTVVDGVANACDRSPSGPPAVPGKAIFLAVLYSMFLHGGLLHLGGNMLYLWVFGNNIEDTRGRLQYLVFYLLAGVVATITHVLTQPSSTVPLVGASGAVAGVMGAYLVLYPNVKIRSIPMVPFLIFFIGTFRISAKWLLGFWFISQFFINPNGGVASMAHVGGFAFGVLAGLLWRSRRPEVPSTRAIYEVQNPPW